MINILKKLSSLILISKNNEQNITKQNKIYNQDEYDKKILYEKWCRKREWLLYDEGILLLLSIDPANKEILREDLIEKINNLKFHASECVKNALLSVINIDKSEYKWKVTPVDLYHWAMVSRINIPDELNTLMAFVTQSVKNPNNSFSTNHKNLIDDVYQFHKEVVLGATTSLLANSPDICRNNEGKIDSTIIVKKIIENERHWFNGCESKLSESDMTSLIKQYIAMSKPIY
tara:strand:+ start:43 stop:738 length:696 start_codon:yes stop_codon:yes gene_type:complete